MENQDYSVLPPHIISMILSYLDFEDLKNAVQVCSLWYYASHHPVITNRIRLCIVKNVKLEIPDISQIIRPFDNIRISHIDFNMIDYKDFFINFGKCIKTINIAFCNISVHQLYEILIYLKNLQSLEFFECKTKPLELTEVDQLINFSEDERNKIIRNLGKIKNLTYSPSLNNLLGFIPIAQHIKCVEKFCLHNTWGLLPQSNELIVNNLFEILNYWNLEKLKSMEVEFISPNKNRLFYENFVKLKNIQLKELRIHEKYEKEHNFNTAYYNQNFSNFCMQNKNLEILEIPSINDNELFDISRNISNLKHLVVGSVNVDRIHEIRNLKTLNILHLCRFSISPLEEALQLFSFKFDYLKDLWLELFIDKNILDLIAENCDQLEILGLNLLTTDCESIFQKLTKLKYLRLWFRMFHHYHYDHPNIGNATESNITNLKELEYLEINGYIPGIEANQIDMLPNLKYSNHKFFDTGHYRNDDRFEDVYDEANENEVAIYDFDSEYDYDDADDDYVDERPILGRF